MEESGGSLECFYLFFSPVKFTGPVEIATKPVPQHDTTATAYAISLCKGVTNITKHDVIIINNKFYLLNSKGSVQYFN